MKKLDIAYSHARPHTISDFKSKFTEAHPYLFQNQLETKSDYSFTKLNARLK